MDGMAAHGTDLQPADAAGQQPAPDAAEQRAASTASNGAARRRGPLRRLGAWYARHVWAATTLLVILVLVAGFVALQLVTLGRVGDGVTVAGVPLQGLSRSEAAAAVAAELGPRVSPVSLDTGGDEPLTPTLAQLGIGIDADGPLRPEPPQRRRQQC